MGVITGTVVVAPNDRNDRNDRRFIVRKIHVT